MASIRKTIRSIFVWSFGRGTIQYDIICALILAFIFFVPRSCFVPKKSEYSKSNYQDARIQHQGAQTDKQK